MIAGLRKLQWLLLTLILSIPTSLNAIAIWQDVGTTTIRKIWNSSYPHPFLGFLGGPYNPLPEILFNLLLYTVPLGLLTWLLIFISNQAFFQKQPLIARLLESVLMVIGIAFVFRIVTGFLMPLIWLPKFHDYLLGLPISPFMEKWSLWLVFPTTAIILFSAVFGFEKVKIDIRPKTS